MDIRFELRQIQLPLAKFEYEVRGKKLNLYDRIDNEKGEDILRFLAQVPYEGDLELSVRLAVEKTYENMNTFPLCRIQAKDLHSKMKKIDYVRDSSDPF